MLMMILLIDNIFSYAVFLTHANCTREILCAPTVKQWELIFTCLEHPTCCRLQISNEIRYRDRRMYTDKNMQMVWHPIQSIELTIMRFDE